jgi:hypothetical protein
LALAVAAPQVATLAPNAEIAAPLRQGVLGHAVLVVWTGAASAMRWAWTVSFGKSHALFYHWPEVRGTRAPVLDSTKELSSCAALSKLRWSPVESPLNHSSDTATN